MIGFAVSGRMGGEMKNIMPYRVYLDYNVIEDLSKDKIRLPEGNYNIFCSVAHGEEYYNACCNASSEYMESALKVKETIKNISKKDVVLNPEKKGVRAKNEKFDACIERIEKNDTRHIVNRNGSFIFKSNKDKVAELRKSDLKSVNNSNLGCEEIWQRPEVLERIDFFQEWYKNYASISNNALLKTYGFSALQVINSDKELPKEFMLCKGCFDKEFSFALLEMVVEYLNDNVLCACGYCKDKTERTTQSGIHDVSHMIYATYCDYFVSKDQNLIRRARAIYYYLGLNTQAIYLDEWLNMDLLI